MSNPTAAQEELADLLAKNAANTGRGIHPEDRDYEANEAATHSEDDEEERFRAAQIDAAMRMPTHDSRADIRLPPPSFDSGCATGVKGVIADARSYETARREKWTSKMRSARRSVFGINGGGGSKHHHHDESGTESDASAAALDDPEEEAFIQRWREERRRQLEAVGTSAPPPARSRRTSPSVRRYGRLDQVDALGYLDAIEKVRRETVVVVFVYDHECPVSSTIEHALVTIVAKHPTVHFVKVHYEEIEFDNAAVPSILAYRNQGDLFANLTGLVEMLPDDEEFDDDSLNDLLVKHGIL